MIFGKKRERVSRRIPKRTGKPLSSRDMLVRLRECWDILNPRRRGELSDDDIEIIGYNMQLATLYAEITDFQKDSAPGPMGFSEGDEDDDPEEDEEFYYVTEIYCGGKGKHGNQ